MTDLADHLRQLLVVPDASSRLPSTIGGDVAVRRVETYLGGTYTGAEFDAFAIDRADSNRITGDDLIAVTMLSIGISSWQSGDMSPASLLELEKRQPAIRALLEQLPSDRELHSLGADEFARLMGPGSAGDALYDLLRRQVGLPRVATHKLCARKRPHLMPIRDGLVEEIVGMQASKAWWQPWWGALSGNPQIVERLATIRMSSRAHHLSLLRIADIVLWMTAKETQKNKGRGPGVRLTEDTTGEP